MSTLSVGAATPLGVWDVAQVAVGFIGGLFGVAGLLGFGPLRTKPEPVDSESSGEDPFASDGQRSVDQLVCTLQSVEGPVRSARRCLNWQSSESSTPEETPSGEGNRSI